MDTKFWRFVWVLVTIFCSITVLSITSCNVLVDYRIEKAISDGTSPAEARYAFSYAVSNSELAIIRLTEKID